jgi:hypothetical protein
VATYLGAKQMLFWEADYIDGQSDREALRRVMRAHSRPPK